MATRNTAVGSQSSSDYLTAAEYNDAAGGLIGYKLITSNQGSITTEVALTNQTLTLTPNASRILKISYNIQFVSTVGNDEIIVNVYKDGVLLDGSTFDVSNLNNIGQAKRDVLDIGPTNASHTYLLKAQRGSTSTGTFTANGSSTNPASFTIEDVGPSF